MAIAQTLSLLGYASGIAAADTRCGDGPMVLQQSDLIQDLAKVGVVADWKTLLKPEFNNNKFCVVANICTELAKQTYFAVTESQQFVVLAGDHSCAIGTWSGVFAARQNQGNIGLIWVDAHMDSHTPETTESGNIHGMPLATLLGYGAQELTSIMTNTPKLQPEHVCLIGVRSFEQGEVELIKRLGVRVYHMDEVHQRGINAVLKEAIGYVNENTAGYGISLDLDGIDPEDAPGTGAPEPNGIVGKDLVLALQNVAKSSKFLGLEIVEFNPYRDINFRTQQLVKDLLVAAFAD